MADAITRLPYSSEACAHLYTFRIVAYNVPLGYMLKSTVETFAWGDGWMVNHQHKTVTLLGAALGDRDEVGGALQVLGFIMELVSQPRSHHARPSYFTTILREIQLIGNTQRNSVQRTNAMKSVDHATDYVPGERERLIPRTAKAGRRDVYCLRSKPRTCAKH